MIQDSTCDVQYLTTCPKPVVPVKPKKQTKKWRFASIPVSRADANTSSNESEPIAFLPKP